MSLLWHDSFSYLDRDDFEDGYAFVTAATTVTFRNAGRRRGAYAVHTGDTEFHTPILQTYSAQQGQNTVILGFALKTLAEPGALDFIRVMASTGTIENFRIRVRRGLTGVPGSNFFFELVKMKQGQPDRVLLRTERYLNFEWHYFEVKIVLSNDPNVGYIEWRSGGHLEKKFEGATEEDSQDVGFDTIIVDSLTIGPIEAAAISDFYILNGEGVSTAPQFARFLGDVSCQAIHPDKSRGEKGRLMEWRPIANPPKYRISVLGGQSNMDGVADLPVPVGVRDPNDVVWIWDSISPVGALVPLIGGTNNTRHLDVPPIIVTDQGPEMGFAEAIADYFEQEATNISNPMKTVIVKAAKNGSFVNPQPDPSFTWDPATPANLLDDFLGFAAAAGRGNMVGDINEAITYVGGAANVESIDFFWYQGESDTTNPTHAAEYEVRLGIILDLLENTHFAGYEVNFHIIQLHADLSPLATFRDKIRAAHQKLAAKKANRYLISVDHIPLAGDDVHYTADGYRQVGEAMFASWKKTLAFGRYLNDFDISTAFEGDGITVNPENARATVKWGGLRNTRGSSIMCAKMFARGYTFSGSADVAVLFANEKADQSFGSMSFGTSSSIGSISLETSPLTDAGFLEEDFQRNDIGFQAL